MTVTNLSDDTKIKQELVVLIRNSDIITTTLRGVTTATETFNGTGAALNFTLAKLNVKNVRSVSVGGVAKTFGTDYTVNYITAVVSFTVAPEAGTNNISIGYDWGNGDKIFDDFPKIQMDISSYPRIVVQITNTISDFGDLGASLIYSDHLISFYIYGTKDTIETLKTSLRNLLLSNINSLYYVRYIKPAGAGPTLPQPERGDKIFLKTLEWRAPLNQEVIT